MARHITGIISTTRTIVSFHSQVLFITVSIYRYSNNYNSLMIPLAYMHHPLLGRDFPRGYTFAAFGRIIATAMASALTGNGAEMLFQINNR
jgi:hypothetical protein